MNNYTIIEKIGEGAHGVVLKASCIKTGQIVALKKVPLRKPQQGIPNPIIREIKALEQLNHPHDVFPSGTGFVLVFEYMLSDLAEVLKYLQCPLSEPQVKQYMLMILKGIDYCHKNHILHRDLKPANLLIAPNRILKLADFGLARVYDDHEKRPFSHQVATRWYRAPELLYGARHYDYGVDLWAIGCIFGELLNHSPLFPGQNDIDQLYSVLNVLGTPNTTIWPEWNQLPDYGKIQFPDTKPISMSQLCPDASIESVTLLSKFLVYDSNHRISAAKALLDPYFFNQPLPSHHLELPLPSRNKMPVFDVDVPLQLQLFSIHSNES